MACSFWAVTFAMLVWLMATGVRVGFNAMLGVATAGTTIAETATKNMSQEDMEAAARRFGFDQTQIDAVKERAKNAPAEARQAVEDPATREKVNAVAREVGDKATKVTWLHIPGHRDLDAGRCVRGYIGSGPSVRGLWHRGAARNRYTRGLEPWSADPDRTQRGLTSPAFVNSLRASIRPTARCARQHPRCASQTPVVHP